MVTDYKKGFQRQMIGHHVYYVVGKKRVAGEPLSGWGHHASRYLLKPFVFAFCAWPGLYMFPEQ